MNQDIEQALTNFRADAERYAKATRYYNGEHDLAFATEKFQNTFGTLFREFALNLCPVICDAVRDKLRVTGFGVEGFAERKSSAFPRERPEESGGFASTGGAAASIPGETDGKAELFRSAREETRRIWMRNRMGTRGGEVHKEALICGNTYMIIWPDSAGNAVFYPNRAANMTVATDDDAPGHVVWAAKHWLDADKHVRLNLFYPDRIEKYISKGESEGSLPDPKDFQPATEAIPNPYGVVPVFHFANNADLGMLGRSELEAAMPVQDGLNKSVLDMLVAMEFSAPALGRGDRDRDRQRRQGGRAVQGGRRAPVDL